MLMVPVCCKYPTYCFYISLINLFSQLPGSRSTQAWSPTPSVSPSDSVSQQQSASIRSVLASWDCVGSTKTARRLIATAIKTCKIVHIFCHQRNIQASSYLSDAYLQEVVERIWTLWKQGGVHHCTMSNLTQCLMI